MYIARAITDNTNHNIKVSIILINNGRLNKFINPPEISNNTISNITAKKSGKNLFIVYNLKG
jgi:hypothetical protein